MKIKLPVKYRGRLAVFLAVSLMAMSFIPGAAHAMFVQAAPQAPAAQLSGRDADLAKIQKALESKVLRQRLMDYGLSPELALTKINALSSGQVHQFAAKIDALQAGGMRDSDFIIVLLLILLIVIIV